MNKSSKSGLELLTETLEIYGSDRTRWPAQVRRELVTVLAESSDGQRLMREAEALDKLLDRAPALDNEKIGLLAQRIAVASRTLPRVAAIKDYAPRQARGFEPRRWVVAATALAASLTIGILAGQSSAVGPAIGEIAGISTAATVTEFNGAGQTALLPDGSDTVFDEELL